MIRPQTKNVMMLSAAALIGLAVSEGFSPEPYRDSGGVLTDGFGNTRQVIEGRKVSVISGLMTLKGNISKAEQDINACVRVPLFQHEFDALVDAAYNLGGNTVCTSSMVKHFNNGDYAAGCNAFMLYDKIKINGKYVSCYDPKNNCRGIIKRREKERAMCYGQY